MAGFVLPAAQMLFGAGSSYFGQKSAKKGMQAQQRADDAAEAKRLGYAAETPEEASRRAMWNSVAQMYAQGRMQPGEQADYERGLQIQRGRRGQEFNAARMQLSNRLARYGQSTSPSGLAQLAKINKEEQQAEEQANILERADRQRMMQDRVAQGFSMINTDLQRGYQNRALMIGSVAPPSTAASNYYNQSAAGYGELGAELMGRGMQGLGSHFDATSNTAATQSPQTSDLSGLEAGLASGAWTPRSGTPGRAALPWWYGIPVLRSVFGNGN